MNVIRFCMRKALATILIFTANSLLVFSQTKSVNLNGLDPTYYTPFVQEQLQPAHYKSGLMQLLHQRTGMSADDIAELYAHSGARLFGQFACAVLAAQRLGVNRETLLQGIRFTNILAVLEFMGVERQAARDAIRASVQEILASKRIQNKLGNAGVFGSPPEPRAR